MRRCRTITPIHRRAQIGGVAANGSYDPGADFEVNTLGHEIEETTTDLMGTAWFDSRGYENAENARGRLERRTRRRRAEGEHEARRHALPRPTELGQRRFRRLRAQLLIID